MLRIPSLEKSSLFRSITRLEKSFSDDSYASGLYRQVLFLEFMIHLNRAALKNRLEFIDTDNCNAKIIHILDYINNHLSENLNIDILAEHFYISKYYLSRTFKEITGYGISEYLNIHRIREAKRLLEETDLSVQQIAGKLGYESITYFEKVFKTYMTMSPLKYRKTMNTVTYTNGPTSKP